MPQLNHQRALIYQLRSYQARALDQFREKRERGENRFHLVAPPGSGKTVVGVQALLEVGRRGVVFSPNSAIQAQWVDRYYASTDVLHGHGAVDARFSTDPGSGAEFLSLTYQSITTKDRRGDWLHENAGALIETIVGGGYQVLVFDECHHLTGFWGDVISGVLARIPDVVCLFLTATPPLEADARAMNRYLGLAGAVDMEIPLPAVVLEGNLAPYQDLVYFTKPEDGEISALLESERNLRALVERLEQQTDGRRSLSGWVRDCLDESLLRGQVVPFPDWLRQDPDRAIAYVRYLGFRKLDPPLSVFWIDEMAAPCETDDLALVLGDYHLDHLNPLKSEATDALAAELQSCLERLGYRFSGRGYHAAHMGAARGLTLSKSKLDGLCRILTAEQDYQFDKIRALILVDYEFGPAGGDGITAVDVMHRLTSDPITDELDPIMVTGRSVLVDDDLTPVFLQFAERFRERRQLRFQLESRGEAGYCRIDGSGPGWTTRTYVSLISELLEAGVTRALVSTRSLLGEGWDSPSLNTLIDLTVVAAYVSVNQIRGRTIRKDPNVLTKCANNWDVVTIVPGAQAGLYDFHRLERKHQHFYGIADDGVIEKGLGHVHPLLSKGNASEIASSFEAINEEMLLRAGKRNDAYDQWKSGDGAAGSALTSLEIKPTSPTTMRVTLDEAKRLEWIRSGYAACTSRARITAWILVGIAVLTVGVLDLGPGVVVATVAGVVISGNAYRRRQMRRLSESSGEVTFEDGVRPFAEAVLATMHECDLLPSGRPGPTIRITTRGNGYLRICLDGSDAETSDLFCAAVWELLGPFQNQKYIIERHQLDVDWRKLSVRQLGGGEQVSSHVVACHPVPSLFSKRKQDALRFQASWHACVGPGELHYTRHGSGKEVAAEWFRKAPLPVHRETKAIWG